MTVLDAAPAIRRTRTAAGDTIYWPATTPLGGIVCLHGSEGGWAGWNDLAACLFAANGFAALSHAYTQPRRWPLHPDIDDVPLESTADALAAMHAQIAPFACGLGLYGISRGAERALLLAGLLAEAKAPIRPAAIAVHAPPDVTWPAFIASDFTTGAPWAGDPARPAWRWQGGHDKTRPGTPLHPSLAQYPIFITQGAADQTWGADMARRLVERLAMSGRAPEAHFFEGEGHVLGPDASNRAWAAMLAFFRRHLSHAARPMAPTA